jgi:hypothetical protein
MKIRFTLEIEENLLEDIREQISADMLPSEFIINAIEEKLEAGLFDEEIDDSDSYDYQTCHQV